MSTRTKNGDPPRWIRPEAVPLLVQLGQHYGDLLRSIEAARDGFRQAQAVELFYPQEPPMLSTLYSVTHVVNRLDAASVLLPPPGGFGPANIFTLLCGEAPFAISRIAQYERAVERELGPDHFPAVQPLIGQIRERMRRRGRFLVEENGQ